MISKIALGSAQFGLNYGINNNSGKIIKKNVFNILNTAYEFGIDTIDTASAYGSSENVIGHWIKKNNKPIKLVSKLTPGTTVNHIEKQFIHSLDRLGVNELYGYLVHHIEDYFNAPELFEQISDLKMKGLVRKVGFSLYEPKQLERLLNDNVQFDLIQVPYNVLDRRFNKYFQILKERNVEVHVRSVFLQGLFFVDLSSIQPSVVFLSPYIMKLQKLSTSFNITMRNMCLNYVLQNMFIDKVIIGIDNLEQLKQNLNAVSLTADNVLFNEIDDIVVKEVELLNPVNWK